ncbi:SDR family oxidoreductase [Hyphomicrobium sp. 99]|uniref:SDR family NAD(P)-dependent oxidoreductase n=1 Tax=Hyphomicrobium sp. 99 TaxID=1163419 RepID=UPI000696CC47|nr:SDR family NAD(P)-dependent oxidoreductase [Hyphomicrobium sp. 99]
MQKSTASWRSLFWPWWSPADPQDVRAARQAVAHLKPAVLITGGASGIGLALARRFLEAGHNTVIVGRDAAKLDAAVRGLTLSKGTTVTAIVCDVSLPDALEVINARLVEAGLYLDVLVSNAGTGLAGSFLSHSRADLSRLIGINVETVTRLMHAVLPDMLARQRGGVLNIASLGADVPGPNQAAYYASKAYVASLTEAVASEYSGQGVRISVLLPGPVDTAFHEDMGAGRSLYRWVLPSMTADRVARSAFRGFMFGNRVIVPGISNIFFYLALRILPHTLTVPLVYWLLRRPEN